jgi:hypothetical protein
MTTVIWNDVYVVVIAVIFLVFFVFRSRNAKEKVAIGIILIVVGAFELFAISAGYLLVFRLANSPNFTLDYYGLTVFLPLIIIVAIASIAFGIRLLSNEKQTVEQPLKP